MKTVVTDVVKKQELGRTKQCHWFLDKDTVGGYIQSILMEYTVG